MGLVNNPDKNGSHAVRCIYDVWYWGDDKIVKRNVFTWGRYRSDTSGKLN